MNLESAKKLLRASDIFFTDEDDAIDPADVDFSWINFNDVWGWASADCECVPEDEIVPLAELFWRYGWSGVLYWASERNNRCRSEFHDINRLVDHVRHEEAIRREEPDSSKRAYLERSYTLGVS